MMEQKEENKLYSPTATYSLATENIFFSEYKHMI